MRRHVAAAAALASTLVLPACQFEGVNSNPLPGTVGTGAGSYTVQVQLPDVGNLTRNAEVKVGNVAVGTITGMAVRDWHAVVTVSLRGDVRLPDNATATVGQNSLLGASYLEMAPPEGEAAAGRLSDGDTIPLRRGDAYPATEQVLAATSVALNGGGLSQLETITTELNRALGGDEHAVADLIPRLNTFMTALDEQRDEIVSAIDGLNRLSGQLGAQRRVLADAVEGMQPALEVLNREREDLTRMLVALDDLGRTAQRVVDASQQDLVANLRNVQPALRALADAGSSLAKSLNLVTTFPFPASGVPASCKGDYCNIFVTLDLTLDTLDANLLSGTPLQGSLADLETLLGERAGTAAEAVDPLREPVQPLLPAPSGAPRSGAQPPAGADGLPELVNPLSGGGR